MSRPDIADIKCAKCHSFGSKVLDSSGASSRLWVRRRRRCLGCGHRFSTYETLTHPKVAANAHRKLKRTLLRLLKEE